MYIEMKKTVLDVSDLITLVQRKEEEIPGSRIRALFVDAVIVCTRQKASAL